MSTDLRASWPIVEKPYLYSTSRSWIKRCSLLSIVLLSVTISAATYCGAVPTVSTSTSTNAALWHAIADDDSQGIIAALKAGAHVDSKEMPEDLFYRWQQFDELKGAPPLFAAIFLKKTDLALLLLAHGADPKSTGPRRITPVQVAIATGDEKVFSALLNKGADILSDPAIRDGSELLHLVDLAAIGGSLEIMSKVRAAGHDLPADPQARVRLLQKSLNGSPGMFEYLVRVTGITLSPELITSLVEQARSIRSDSFLQYFHRKGYLEVGSLPQILTEAIGKGMDGLAEELLVAHPDLWSTDMTEAITRRIRHHDPMPMVELFFRLGKKDIPLPFLDLMFLNCGLNGDAEAIESLLKKFQVGKSREPRALGLALLGAVKGLYETREAPPIGPPPDRLINMYRSLADTIMQKPQVDINVADEEGRTPLWFAIQNDDQELAKRLLTNGAKANPEPADSYNNPGFLHSACQHGMTDLVTGLVGAGADLEARDYYGMTPLGCAVENKNAAMVQALLTAGADPNSLNSKGTTDVSKTNPFLDAVAVKDKAIISIFLQPAGSRQIDPELFGPATILAIKSGEVDILEQILATGKAFSEQNVAFFQDTLPIIHALYEHQPGMIGPLVKYGAELVPAGHTAAEMMCYAVDREGLEMTRALLDAGLGADVSCLEIPLLSKAVIKGDVDLIALLLERGADINAVVKTGDRQGWTPLLFAVNENKPEVVDLLVGKGASAEALGLGMLEIEVAKPWDQKPKTMTPLLKAAQLGRVGMIRSMIRAGANIDKTNSEEYTALMVAARFGQADAVKTLLQLGADAALVNNHRSGALELAVISENIAVQKLLLGKTGDRERDKAIVLAARLGEFETIDKLLRGDGFKARELDRALLAAIRANPENAPPRDLIMQEKEGLVRLKIVKALAAAGADPSTGAYGSSTFSTLINNGYDAAWQKQVALLLNELGADVNLPDKGSGDTVLREAARVENAEMAELFLKFGADPCLRNKSGGRALDLVPKDPANKLRQVLIKGGAEQCEK